MDDKNKNIATIITVILLTLTIIGHWPYGFYTLLRLMVFGTTVYLSWLACKSGRQGWIWVFGFIALVFNPLIPLHLDKDLWRAVDLVTAVFLVFSIFSFKVLNVDNV